MERDRVTMRTELSGWAVGRFRPSVVSKGPSAPPHVPPRQQLRSRGPRCGSNGCRGLGLACVRSSPASPLPSPLLCLLLSAPSWPCPRFAWRRLGSKGPNITRHHIFSIIYIQKSLFYSQNQYCVRSSVRNRGKARRNFELGGEDGRGWRFVKGGGRPPTVVVP